MKIKHDWPDWLTSQPCFFGCRPGMTGFSAWLAAWHIWQGSRIGWTGSSALLISCQPGDPGNQASSLSQPCFSVVIQVSQAF